MRLVSSSFCNAIMLLILAASPARGQQTITQYDDGFTPAPFERELPDLDRAVALTPEQTERANAILHAGSLEAATLAGDLRRAIAKFMIKTVPADSMDQAFAQFKESWQEKYTLIIQYQDRLLTVERRTMGDLLALLTPEQVKGHAIASDVEDDRGSGGWPAFERARRFRVAESMDWLQGDLPVSPRTAVAGLKLLGDDHRVARIILERYEQNESPLVVAFLQARDEQRAHQRETRSLDGGRLDAAVLRHPEIRQMRLRALKELGEQLTPEAARRLLGIRIACELRNDGLQPPGQSTRLVLNSLASLSADQRRAIEDLSASADAQALKEIEKLLGAQDRMDYAEARSRGKGVRQAAMDNTKAALQVIVLDLLKDLNSVLSPAQRDELAVVSIQLRPGTSMFTEPASLVPSSSWISPPK
jgi:hypothetical protein